MVTSFGVCCLPSQRAGRFLVAEGMAFSVVQSIPRAIVPRTPDPGRRCSFPHDDRFKNFRETQ